MSEKHSDDAVSEVIAFMLIFAMLVVALAAWAVLYIPSEGYKSEIQHNELSLNQFSDLKLGIDQLWSSEKYVTSNRIISLSPTKGTDLSRILFLAPSFGSGTVKIGSGTAFTFYENESTTDLLGNKKYEEGAQHNVSMLRISYTSNNEFSNDFKVVYDGGAVFYGDVDEDSYLLASPIYGTNNGDNVLYVVNATFPTEKIVLGNYPIPITYEYTGKSEPYSVYGYSGNFTMTSEYSDYWYKKILIGKNITKIVLLNYNVSIGVGQ